MASSSSGTPPYEYSTCICGLPAPLRRSKTANANPGRRFLGCANWKRKEKRCKYFFWVDPASQEKELEAKNVALEKMSQDLSKENKKLKKKMKALEAKVISYKIWCAILIVVCISLWLKGKNAVVGSVLYLP